MQRPDLLQRLDQIQTHASTDPAFTYFHIHRGTISAPGLTLEAARDLIKSQNHLALINIGEEKFTWDYLYEIISLIARHPLIDIVQILPSDKTDEVKIQFAVPHESNVVPDTVEAVYSLLGIPISQQIIDDMLGIAEIKKQIEEKFGLDSTLAGPVLIPRHTKSPQLAV